MPEVLQDFFGLRDLFLGEREKRAASRACIEGQTNCKRNKILDKARRRGVGAQQQPNFLQRVAKNRSLSFGESRQNSCRVVQIF